MQASVAICFKSARGRSGIETPSARPESAWRTRARFSGLAAIARRSSVAGGVICPPSGWRRDGERFERRLAGRVDGKLLRQPGHLENTADRFGRAVASDGEAAPALTCKAPRIKHGAKDG